VAIYCSKCGSEIPAGNANCNVCGASVAPAASTAVPPPAMAPPVTTGGGSSAIKIVLIIVAIVVFLGVLGLGAVGYVAWKVARAVHVNNANGEVTVNTAQGSMTANTKKSFTASELGIDIYPGAQSAEGGMRMSLPTGTMISGAFETSDSPDQVVSFYKAKAGSDAAVMEAGEGAVITLKKSEKEAVVVTVSADSSKPGGKTQIHIVHTVSAKAS